MHVKFNFHQELCVGCGSCVVACINENKIDVDIGPPYRTMGKNEWASKEKIKITYFSTACMHCQDAPCEERCPKFCYTVNNETGVVVLDNSNCIGCGLCVKACEFEAIRFTKENKAIKCNGCIHRLQPVENSRLPMCVLACPRHAITIDEKNEAIKEGRNSLKEEIQKNKANHYDNGMEG